MPVLTAAVALAMAPFAPAAVSAPSSGTPVVSDDSAPAVTVERIAGANRYATAAEVAQQWKPGVRRVYVVSGEDHADAMAAAARAGVFNAPLLLTHSDSVPSSTAQALERLSPGRIVVVGGRGSVSRGVLNQLGEYAGSEGIERVAGDNRYDTSAEVARRYKPGRERVYLVSGDRFADALSAAAIASSEHAPLLLTRRSDLPGAVAAELQRLNAGEVVVVGGTASVSGAVANQAANYTRSGTFRRLSGDNRYETSAAVAEEFRAPASKAYVASGEAYPDALSSAALAGTRKRAVVLTPRDSVADGTRAALNHLDADSLVVVGGTSAVSESTLAELRGDPSQPKPPAPQPPAPSGVSTGAYNGMGAEDDEEFVELVGGMNLTHAASYYTSGDVDDNWPKQRDQERLADGTAVLMGMASKNHNDGGANSFMAWEDIADGRYDAEIREWGRKLAPLGGDVWFAFDIEPDVKLTQGKVPGDWTAADFAAASRRVSTLVKDEAPNVSFVFWVGGHQKDLVNDMYPGDDVVDTICWDPYVTAHRSPDTTPLQLWSEFKNWLDDRPWGDGKTIGLCETGFHNGHPDAKGAAFWDKAPAAAEQLGLSFITYFHSNSGPNGDYLMNNRPHSAESFGDAMRDLQP